MERCRVRPGRWVCRPQTEGIELVRTDVYDPIRNRRRRVDLPAGRRTPDRLSGRRIEGVKLEIVRPYVDHPVGHRRRRPGCRRRDDRWSSGGPAEETGNSRYLFLREFFFEFTGQLMYVGCFAERLNFLFGRAHIHAHVLAEFLQHLKNGCKFLFRKHADLKI